MHRKDPFYNSDNVAFLCFQRLHLEMMKDQPRVTAYQTAIKEASQFISGKVCCAIIT